MLGVRCAPNGTSETETLSPFPSGSVAVPTSATVGVGVPRMTVIPPGKIERVGGALFVEVIVRFASEMSKKMLPTASTLIRPWAEATLALLGIVTTALPLLGMLAARTVGKVWPPSVESVILTLAVLIGAIFELATFQVTVTCEPPAIVVAVLGAVMAKGPAALTEVTVVEP